MDINSTERAAAGGQTPYQKQRASEQTKARLTLHNLLMFKMEHNEKFMTLWECNFLEQLEHERRVEEGYVITERQQNTLNGIYKKLQIGGHL